MTAASEELEGRTILVVEDSPVVGPFVSDLLTEIGCSVIGPAPTMAAARALVEAGGFDAALMDVHIRGERVFPLCDILAASGIPFVLTSGYADWKIPEQWSDRPRLHKPYVLEGMRDALRTAFAS